MSLLPMGMTEVTTIRSTQLGVLERRHAYNADATTMVELTIHGLRLDDASPLEYRVRYWARRGRAGAQRQIAVPGPLDAARRTGDRIWRGLVEWVRC